MAVQEQRTLPAKFVEDLGVDLAKQITAQTGVPIVTGGIGSISQQAGETAEGFKARQDAARAFTTRQQNLAGLAPQVAGQDALQQQAQTLATQGVGSYQPFLQAAQGATGPQAYQQFMSPYQSQVMEASLAEFDRNAAMQQQGFGQAQQAAQQQFQNQQGLAQLVPGLQGTDISRLGSLGALNQAQTQAGLDATREANRMAAYQPQEQLQNYGNLVTGIMGGMAGSGTQTSQVPDPGFLQTALGAAATGAGIYGALK